MKTYMILLDDYTHLFCEPVPIEEVIYNQDEIVFDFGVGGTLPYKDFLLNRDDYELFVENKEE